jgi:hypothetical protein
LLKDNVAVVEKNMIPPTHIAHDAMHQKQ